MVMIYNTNVDFVILVGASPSITVSESGIFHPNEEWDQIVSVKQKASESLLIEGQQAFLLPWYLREENLLSQAVKHGGQL